jgi:uncharacterized protein
MHVSKLISVTGCQMAMVILAAFTLLPGCTADRGITPEQHRAEVLEWQNQRLERLRDPSGWLGLAGMYWFEKPVQTFGTDLTVDFLFPEGSIAGHAGHFELRGESVLMVVEKPGDFTADGMPLTDELIYHDGESKEIRHGRLTWSVISRGGLTGIRLYNTESHVLKNFSGVEFYPADLAYRFEARLVPDEQQRLIPVTNILGQTVDTESPGRLVFERDGERHELVALGSPDDERLFIIISDETSRTETYPGGRYIYVDNPGPGGTTILDFNKVYNPPCAFSPYTTCQLPPEGNALPFAVKAGEKLPL